MRNRIGVLLLGVGLALLGLSWAPPPGSGYAGSGSCSGGYCQFCSNVTLGAYGAGGYQDRCAYGYFVGANTVEGDHSTGAVNMCAGMKSGADGGGTNVAPNGVTCTTYKTYIVFTPYSSDTRGYATIINKDPATHYNFYAIANY